MALGTVNGQYLDGTYAMNCAQETYAAADRAVAQIIRQCHQEARQLLIDNREMLDAVASYLLKKETITGQEMMAILDGKDPEQAEYYGLGPAQSKLPQGGESPAQPDHTGGEPVPMPTAEGPVAEDTPAGPDVPEEPET